MSLLSGCRDLLLYLELIFGVKLKVQSWKLFPRLLNAFQISSLIPPPHTMMNCGPIINIVGNIVLGEAGRGHYFFSSWVLEQNNNRMALPNSDRDMIGFMKSLRILFPYRIVVWIWVCRRSMNILGGNNINIEGGNMNGKNNFLCMFGRGGK